MSQYIYAVVEFKESRTVSTIPLRWLNKEGDTCLWPPKSLKANLTKLIKFASEPDYETWEEYSVRQLWKAGKVKNA